MEKNLDKFIISIRANEKPFVYEAPHETAQFLLSYDESIDALDNEDFRPYIIAALHAKGAVSIKSYVRSTIVFLAQCKDRNTIDAILNWKKYLAVVFGTELTLVLGATRSIDGGDYTLDKIPNFDIESSFDGKVTLVKEKFKTLKAK